MDWATADYTRTYADTFFLPEPDHDAGVYLLDEAGRDTDPEDRARVPIRPYGDSCGRYGRPIREPGRVTPYDYARSRGLREGFYGNIVSSKRNNHAIFDAAWDERPMHYNPNAGSDWAHLVPHPSQRPYGGGPAPSLAFPKITASEALNGPKDLFQGHVGDAGASPPSAQEVARREARREVSRTLQIVKVVLLVVVVVLLAMTLASTYQMAKGLERSVQEVVGVLRATASAKA
jgi:hypothetical protein